MGKKSWLRIHQKIHQEREFKNNEDDFKTEPELDLDHLDKQEPVGNHRGFDMYECKTCRERCTKKVLKYHALIHAGVKPYQCKTCDKSFLKKMQLVNHENTHLENKPFPCGKCGKSFATKWGLKVHKMCVPNATFKVY